MFTYIDGDYTANHTADRAQNAIVEQRQSEYEFAVKRRKNEERQPYKQKSAHDTAQPAVIRFFEREQATYKYGKTFDNLIYYGYCSVGNVKQLDRKRGQ